jgi:hypothetical protein
MAEERHGIRGTVHDGVFFTDKSVPGVVRLGAIRVEISRQNANLGAVKDRMVREAKSKGADTIQNFNYGQRAHKWWEKVFTLKWDTESWYGEGEACRTA